MPVATLKVTTETSVNGSELNLIIKIKNTGAVEARNISFTMNTPSGLERKTLVGAYPAGTAISGRKRSSNLEILL